MDIKQIAQDLLTQLEQEGNKKLEESVLLRGATHGVQLLYQKIVAAQEAEQAEEQPAEIKEVKAEKDKK